MKQPPKPSFIKNWREIEAPAAPPNATEDFGFASELSDAGGLKRYRVAHLRIPAGTRAYPPLAMDELEIFAFVLEGAPDLYADGYLYRLAEGDGVTLAPHSGLAHTLINNGKSDARIFVMSEAFRRNSRAIHPGDEAANENLRKMNMLWTDAPPRKRGPNSGKPGSDAGRKRARPDYVWPWRDLLGKDKGGYPGSIERHGIDASFGRKARFSRIGIHFEVLKPGRRTSWPHAERDEDEFGYVVSGNVDAWTDGWITPMAEGDFVGWPAGTGIAHCLINNSDSDALLLIGGEASRERCQIFYPLHPHRDKETGERFWHDHPKRKLGPHDCLSDRMREALPPRMRKDAIAANRAAMKRSPRK